MCRTFLPYKQRVGGSNPSTPTPTEAAFLTRFAAFFVSVCGVFELQSVQELGFGLGKRSVYAGQTVGLSWVNGLFELGKFFVWAG